MILILAMAGCQSIQILDIPSAHEPLRKSVQSIPLTVVITHLRDQSLLDNSESSVAVTLVFAEALKKAALFDSVIYAAKKPADTGLEFRVDFERTFQMHYFSNEMKNLFLLASVFLLYPWLKIRVDYSIRGRLEVISGEKVIKSYSAEGGATVYMSFLSSYEKAADLLGARSMNAVSERLISELIKDEGFFLAYAVERATKAG